MATRGNVVVRIVFTAFLIFFITMFAVNIFRTFGGSTPVTFTGFLDFVSNTKPLIPNWVVGSHAIDGDWWILDGLRLFFNIIINAFDFLLWIGSQAINLVTYFAQFFSFVSA